MVLGSEAAGAFPQQVRTTLTAGAWAQVGRLSEAEFRRLNELLEELAQRLTVAALVPDSQTRARWRVECPGGPVVRCEVDLDQRTLTVRAVERGAGGE